jgi:hypothetical protein
VIEPEQSFRRSFNSFTVSPRRKSVVVSAAPVSRNSFITPTVRRFHLQQQQSRQRTVSSEDEGFQFRNRLSSQGLIGVSTHACLFKLC